MKLQWSVEPDGAITLRDEKRAPRVHVGHRKDDWGYIATILESGLPSAGPYKSIKTAAKWSQEWITKNLFPDATFGEVPEFRWRGTDR